MQSLSGVPMSTTIQPQRRNQPGDRTKRRAFAGSATQYVFEELRRRIINLDLAPGADLSIRELIEDFGTSQTPIREAVLKLSGEDLVDIYPQAGTRVSLIDVQHARETHFLRLSVEIEILRSLASTVSEGVLDELGSWIARQRDELARSDDDAFKVADNQFHDALFRAGRVPGLVELLASRRGHYDRIRGLFLRHRPRRKAVIAEHVAILKALKAQDPIAAEAAIRRHLGKSLAIVDELRELHPDYFLPL